MADLVADLNACALWHGGLCGRGPRGGPPGDDVVDGPAGATRACRRDGSRDALHPLSDARRPLPDAPRSRRLRLRAGQGRPRQITGFATTAVTEQAENIVLIGGTGTGKTHLATALGIEAVTRQARPLLLDGRTGQHPRTGKGQWVGRSSGPPTGALLDRLTHHCHIIETGNESYRFRHSSQAAKARITSREQARRTSREGPTDTTLTDQRRITRPQTCLPVSCPVNFQRAQMVSFR